MKLIIDWGIFFNDSMTLFGTGDTISHQVTVLFEIFVAEMARKSFFSVISAFYLLCGLPRVKCVLTTAFA